MSQPTTLAYRPDVDGLRALAVIVVILFHAGVPGFAGGYVGVDIFFVISGFLIAGIIQSDIDRKRFSLANFYERRIRRIAPALLVTLLGTAVAGYVLLLPDQFANLGKQIVAAILFVSNVKFWRGGDYWTSETWPLLHTWSLSVEEQFYLFFPLLLVGLAGRASRNRWLIALAALSLLVGSVGVFVAPSATFYLIPGRIWELLLGAMLSLNIVRPIGRYREAIAAGGLAAILVAVFGFGATTPFPGLAALLPCLGAAAIIASGTGPPTAVHALLRHRLSVGIGLLSYSLYLIHFPVIVFARLLLAREDLGALAIAVVLTLTAILAFLSWRFIEQPFRDRARFTRARLLVVIVPATAASLALAAAMFISNGAPSRFPRDALAYAAFAQDEDVRHRSCLEMPEQEPVTPPDCELGDRTASSGRRILLWGDSHVEELATALDAPMARQGIGLMLRAGAACPPLVGLPLSHLSVAARTRCTALHKRTLAQLDRAPQVDTVVLVGYWPAYARDDHAGLAAMREALGRTRERLRGRKVILVIGGPVSELSLPDAMARRAAIGTPMPRLRWSGPEMFGAELDAARWPGLEVVDIRLLLCGRAGSCPASSGSHLVLRDTNHLTASVVRERVAPAVLARILAPSPGSPPGK